MLEIAVEVVCVVPVRVGVLRQGQPWKAAVRLIQHVHLDLFLDHALLVLEILLRDREAPHAIGFGPEHRLERVRWKRLVVIGEVEARRAVQCPAETLHELEELSLLQILGALEHQMLEQVRKARPILGLDAKTDVVVHADRGDRKGMIGGEHDLQAVRQLVVLDRYVQCGRRRFGGDLGFRARLGAASNDRQRHGAQDRSDFAMN